MCSGPSQQQLQIQNAEINQMNAATQQSQTQMQQEQQAFGLQKQQLAQTQQFYTQLLSMYQQSFGATSDIFKGLVQGLQPIFQAGPSQMGFSPQELAALNTKAMDTTSQGYQQTMQAVNERMAARGGGAYYTPSGAEAQIQSSVAQNAENQLSSEQLGITQAGYDQGLKNYQFAAGMLGGIPQAEASTFSGFTGPLTGAANAASSAAGVLSGVGGLSSSGINAATGSSNAAANEANTIQAQSNSWMGMLGGVLSGVTSGFTGGLSGLISGLGGSGGSSNGSGGIYDSGGNYLGE